MCVYVLVFFFDDRKIDHKTNRNKFSFSLIYTLLSQTQKERRSTIYLHTKSPVAVSARNAILLLCHQSLQREYGAFYNANVSTAH
jgi:hypothetical protein